MEKIKNWLGYLFGYYKEMIQQRESYGSEY